ncbi:MAG: SDR family oxidoreductase [Bryobacteraceae bacterium]
MDRFANGSLRLWPLAFGLCYGRVRAGSALRRHGYAEGAGMNLKGHGIVITGASQGLGKAIAEECVKEGADLLICARDAGLLAEARTALAGKASSGQRVLAQPVDVSRPLEVKQLLETATNELPNFSGLVNNAGTYGPKGLLEDVDIQEWWHVLEVNLLGTMLTCREALKSFRRKGYGKIVNLSGGGATAPLPRISAYAASKAAVVRLTETLAGETAGSGIDVNAVAPGALNTRMLDEVLVAGPERVGSSYYERAVKQKREGGSPLGQAARLCVFLLSERSDGITGRLISAVWDSWKDLPDHLEELRGSDIYTLRRIVPEDRQRTWKVK